MMTYCFSKDQFHVGLPRNNCQQLKPVQINSSSSDEKFKSNCLNYARAWKKNAITPLNDAQVVESKT